MSAPSEPSVPNDLVDLDDVGVLNTSGCIVVTDDEDPPNSLPWCEIARMSNAGHVAALGEIAAELQSVLDRSAELAATTTRVADKLAPELEAGIRHALGVAAASMDADSQVVARDDLIREGIEGLTPLFAGGADAVVLYDDAVAVVDAIRDRGWLTIRWVRTNSRESVDVTAAEEPAGAS